MKNIFKEIIEKKNYKLEDLLVKIDRYHIEGKLTDDEKEELTAYARDNARFENGVDVLKKLEEFEERIKTLENSVVLPKEEDYPPYKDGHWYYKGDKCSENGINYICTAPDGVVCVWSPSVYPAYWEKA